MLISYITTNGGVTIQGEGQVDQFSIGFNTNTCPGTFTNTGQVNLSDPILVMAVLDERHYPTLDAFHGAVLDTSIPTGLFYFIPDYAVSDWAGASGSIWLSRPFFGIRPGSSVNGTYVPLTALPPFGSRAEIGNMSSGMDTSISRDIKMTDFFAAAFHYFDRSLTTASDRLKVDSFVDNLDTAARETGRARFGATNFGTTFTGFIYQNSAIYDADEKGNSPYYRLSWTDYTTGDILKPTLTITNQPPTTKPSLNVRMQDINGFGQHGADTVGNSGYINNKNIGGLTAIFSGHLKPDIDSVGVDLDPYVVAGVTYQEQATLVHLYNH